MHLFKRRSRSRGRETTSEGTSTAGSALATPEAASFSPHPTSQHIDFDHRDFNHAPKSWNLTQEKRADTDRGTAEAPPPPTYEHATTEMPVRSKDAASGPDSNLPQLSTTKQSTLVPSEDTDQTTGLSKADAKALFFGAPHFMLEKGKHGKAFPQVFFPWNTDMEVLDLTDHKPLAHESFGIATLHAHVPIPDSDLWKPSTQTTQPIACNNRQSFDLGIFEVPNMLSLDGKEPGTVGFRYFLEIPLAQHVLQKAPSQATNDTKHSAKENLIATAFGKEAKHSEGLAQIGKHAKPQDRLQLAAGGPEVWKRIGVRDITIKMVSRRLATLSGLHDTALGHFKLSLVDKQTPAELHKELFEDFLYWPDTSGVGVDLSDIKIQIESLVKVLTTPGAWIDFSDCDSRSRLGQILWQRPPDTIHLLRHSDTSPDAERTWLLVQILLSVELVLRLDVALRLGIAARTEGFELSGSEIHHFNKLRNEKVNWDLVLARRFLDLVRVKEQSQSHAGAGENVYHHFSAGNLLHKGNKSEAISSWACPIVPRQSEAQIAGLLMFARKLSWPNVADLAAKFAVPSDGKAAVGGTRSRLSAEGSQSDGSAPSSWSKWNQDGHVRLSLFKDHGFGGWVTKSWVTGLVLPGQMTSMALMAALLENDPTVMKAIGGESALHGGLLYRDQTWWNIRSVVGRVLAPLRGSQTIGWITIPGLILNTANGDKLGDGWYEPFAHDIPTLRSGRRIDDGPDVAQSSSPLGIGHGKVSSKEFILVEDRILDTLEKSAVEFSTITLTPLEVSGGSHLTNEAEAAFRIQSGLTTKACNIKLRYDAYFVTAHTCRRAPVHTHRQGIPNDDGLAADDNVYLAAHPLHQSYKYSIKSVPHLLESIPPNPTKSGSETWIVDATSSSAAEVLVRAWCANVGSHGLIARVGKVCLSCALREAKALQIAILIRVGQGHIS